MKIGYIRVSTQAQNTMRQEVLMQELGVDEVYIDRLSGKNTDRPELKKMMDYVRKGDTVIVESISRFARNTRDLLELIEKLSEKGGKSFSVVRIDEFDSDALTTHKEGEVILSGKTSIGYTGFENKDGISALSFGYPYREAPVKY